LSTPQDLRYNKTHEWVRVEADGTATVGITFHAQEQLGDVVFVECPAVGRQVKQGEECGVVESVKAASDIYAPVSGEVVARNDELETAPQKLNEAPYDAWMFRLKLADASELGTLLDAAAYQQIADADKH